MKKAPERLRTEAFMKQLMGFNPIDQLLYNYNIYNKFNLLQTYTLRYFE